MGKLPPPEMREWLLDCLRMLVRREGVGPLVRPPLSTPVVPGAWTPDAVGLARCGRVLLDHAGLGGDVLRIRPAPPAPLPSGRLLALTSYGDGVIRLELSPELPDDRPLLAGLLALEVVRVWRTRRGLGVVDNGLEEELTAPTGVFLGFGLLLARLPRNRAEAFAALPPPLLEPSSLAWLLAAQHVARGGGRWGAWRMGWQVGAPVRQALWPALEALRGLPGGLHERLQMTAPTKGKLVHTGELRRHSVLTDSDGPRS